MDFPDLHSWNLSPKDAIALQKALAGRVEVHDRLVEPVRLVAGVDVSSARCGASVHAAVVVYDLDRSVLVATAAASLEAAFPYVPGLLSFRELPVVLAAFRRLAATPDVVLVDGQGIAHPRRFGIACHLGVHTGIPAIGCAKSRLIGTYQEPGQEKGCWSPLQHDGVEIGAVLRTRTGVKPLFISPGHLVTLADALAMVLRCCTRWRLPEPVRKADHAAEEAKRDLGASGDMV